jgi:hypothetical protein
MLVAGYSKVAEASTNDSSSHFWGGRRGSLRSHSRSWRSRRPFHGGEISCDVVSRFFGVEETRLKEWRLENVTALEARLPKHREVASGVFETCRVKNTWNVRNSLQTLGNMSRMYWIGSASKTIYKYKRRNKCPPNPSSPIRLIPPRPKPTALHLSKKRSMPSIPPWHRHVQPSLQLR